MAATMRQVRIEVMPDTRLSKNGLRRSNWRTSQALVKQARDDAFFLGLAEKPADHVGTYAMRHEKVKTVRENRISITITPVRESERIGYER